MWKQFYKLLTISAVLFAIYFKPMFLVLYWVKWLWYACLVVHCHCYTCYYSYYYTKCLQRTRISPWFMLEWFEHSILNTKNLWPTIGLQHICLRLIKSKWPVPYLPNYIKYNPLSMRIFNYMVGFSPLHSGA